MLLLHEQLANSCCCYCASCFSAALAVFGAFANLCAAPAILADSAVRGADAILATLALLAAMLLLHLHYLQH